MLKSDPFFPELRSRFVQKCVWLLRVGTDGRWSGQSLFSDPRLRFSHSEWGFVCGSEGRGFCVRWRGSDFYSPAALEWGEKLLRVQTILHTSISLAPFVSAGRLLESLLRLFDQNFSWTLKVQALHYSSSLNVTQCQCSCVLGPYTRTMSRLYCWSRDCRVGGRELWDGQVESEAFTRSRRHCTDPTCETDRTHGADRIGVGMCVLTLMTHTVQRKRSRCHLSPCLCPSSLICPR